MKTIEERAKEYAKRRRYELTAYESYMVGASEQNAIDIEKAKTAFNNTCGWLSTYPWYNAVVEEFIKAMEG